MKPYRSQKWKTFRNEVIRLDGGACSNCGKTTSDGAILQVHHKQYFSGRDPWDYPYNLCETLCKGCHAAEHGLIPPKFGWEHVGWDDLGEPNGICECCGTSIRYIFLVQHPKWLPIEVGEICCDNLTSTQVASGLMESKRRYASRLKTFSSSSRWHETKNHIHRIKQKGFIVEIIPTSNGFKIRVNFILGKKTFPSLIDAKIKIFDLIESGELQKCEKLKKFGL